MAGESYYLNCYNGLKGKDYGKDINNSRYAKRLRGWFSWDKRSTGDCSSGEREKLRIFNGDIIFTKDTHGEDYMNTQEGQNLPVPHCIKGTPGHEIINELQPYVKKALAVFEKETFGSRKLANFLKELHKEKEIRVYRTYWIMYRYLRCV